MSIMVAFVGRPVGMAHGDEGEDGRADIEDTMRGVGEQGQRSGQQGGSELQRRDHERGDDRPSAAVEAGVSTLVFNLAHRITNLDAVRMARRWRTAWNIYIPWCGWVIS